jgi:hypothetical protein
MKTKPKSEINLGMFGEHLGRCRHCGTHLESLCATGLRALEHVIANSPYPLVVEGCKHIKLHQGDTPAQIRANQEYARQHLRLATAAGDVEAAELADFLGLKDEV